MLLLPITWARVPGVEGGGENTKMLPNMDL